MEVACSGLEGILRLCGKCSGYLEGVWKVSTMSGRYLEAGLNTLANLF